MATTGTLRYVVKCDECKAVLRETDNIRESYAGGTCGACREAIRRHLERAAQKRNRAAA